jgi:hypothetical protein
MRGFVTGWATSQTERKGVAVSFFRFGHLEVLGPRTLSRLCRRDSRTIGGLGLLLGGAIGLVLRTVLRMVLSKERIEHGGLSEAQFARRDAFVIHAKQDIDV